MRYEGEREQSRLLPDKKESPRGALREVNLQTQCLNCIVIVYHIMWNLLFESYYIIQRRIQELRMGGSKVRAQSAHRFFK